MTSNMLYTQSKREGYKIRENRNIWMQLKTHNTTQTHILEDEQVPPVCIYRLINIGFRLFNYYFITENRDSHCL